jgi:SH3 domain protein
MQKWLMTILMISLSLVAQAEPESGATRYVSDEITIMLRTGPSNKHKIIRALTTGTKLDAMETKDEYQHVRTHSGLEGWVLSQHLTDKPIARQQLAGANKKLAQLDAENKQLQQQIAKLRENYNNLDLKYRSLDKTKSDTEAELNRIRTIAAEPLQLSNEKQRLSQQTESLEGEVDTLKSELQQLRKNTNKQWFLTGAAVVLLGILIGLTIPKLRRRRASDWGSSLKG